MAGGRYGLALDGCRGVREQHPRRAQLQAGAVRDCTTRDSIDRRTIKSSLMYLTLMTATEEKAIRFNGEFFKIRI